MLMLFDDVGVIDYVGFEWFIEWYLVYGFDVLFVVVQLSEMQFLSLVECVVFVCFVVEWVGGCVFVVVFGYISDDFDVQVVELCVVVELGVQGVVFVINWFDL